jgi:spore coat protein CotF
MTLEISKLPKDQLKKMVKDVEDVLNYNYDLLFYKRKNLAKSLKESIIEVWE